MQSLRSVAHHVSRTEAVCLLSRIQIANPRPKVSYNNRGNIEVMNFYHGLV